MKKIKKFIAGLKNSYKEFALEYPKLDSAIHTFIASFLTAVGVAISVIPNDQLLSPATWSTSFIFALVNTGLRAGFRAVTTK